LIAYSVLLMWRWIQNAVSDNVTRMPKAARVVVALVSAWDHVLTVTPLDRIGGACRVGTRRASIA
jgi:hypothetical protein